MAISSRAKIYTPDLLNAAQVPYEMLTMGASLERSLCPTFANMAARDAAITSAVLSADPFGGAGLTCFIVGSGKWEHNGTSWVPCGPRVIGTYTANASQGANMAANGGVTYVAGAHGQQFILVEKRTLRVTADYQIGGDTAGQVWRLNVYDTAGSAITVQDYVVVAGGAGFKYGTSTSSLRQGVIGTQGFGCTFSLISGAGTASLGSLKLTVTDEGPA